MNAILLTVALACGGWGGGSCGPVGPAASIPAELRWLQHDDDRDCYCLFRGNVQIAAYRKSIDVYRTYDAAAKTWGPSECPPWREKATPRKFEQKIDLEKEPGLQRDKFDLDDRGWRLNGRPISEETARAILRGEGIPDDSRKLRLTVIGSEAERKPVLADLAAAPALAGIREQLVIQDYPPGHWALKCGFRTDGHPTIYLQSPDGKVLSRQDAYGGPEQLAGAIRKARPDYKPDADPNLSKPTPLVPGVNFGSVPPMAWLAGLAGISFLALNRRQS